MRRDLIDEVVSSPKVEAQLDKLHKGLDKVVTQITLINKLGKGIDFTKGFTASTAAAQEARAATEELKRARAELARQEQETRNAIAQSRLEQQRYRTETDKTKAAEAAYRAEKRKNKESIAAEKGSIIDLRNTLKSLQAQYDSLGKASRRSIGGRDLLAQIRATDAELKKLEATTGRFQRNVGNYPKMLGGLQGFLGGTGLGVTLGAAGAGVVAKQVFDTTLQLDSLNAALMAVTQSDEEFAKSQQFLLDVSDRLGLNIIDLTQSYKNFYAAGTQAGLTADQTRSIFQSVSEVAANLRLSQEDVNGVFTAFGQIASKGKVQAEELRGQIGERIPGAFAMAARAIGVTQQQLNKMMEQGQVMALDFLPKFAKELEKTFGVENGERVEGLASAINRLSNEFTELVSNNQSGLSRFFTSIIEGLRGLLNGFNSILERVQNVDVGRWGRLIDGDVTQEDVTRDFGRSQAEIDEERKKALKAGNDAFIKEFEEAYDKQQAAMTAYEDAKRRGRLTAEIKMQRDETRQRVQSLIKNAEILAKAAKKESEKYGDDRFVAGANPFQLGESAKRSGRATRAQDVLFQEEDRLNRIRKALADKVQVSNPPSGLTKAGIDAAARLRERQRKALLDAAGIELQTAIDAQKEIVENEKVVLQERLGALATYRELREQQINESVEWEKKKEGILPEEIKALEAKANSDRLKNHKEFWKEYGDVVKSAADEQTKAILNAYDSRNSAIDKQESEEIARESDRLKSGQYTQEQYELVRLQVTNKHANIRLQAEIESARKVLEVLQKNGLVTIEQQKRLNDLEKQLRDENLKYFEDTEKRKTETLSQQISKRKELEEQYNYRLVELRQSAFDFAVSLGDSLFERQKNRVQESIDQVDKEKEAQIEATNRQMISEEEKANRISVINQTSQARREALERKQRDIDQRAAQFQKTMALFQIGLTTAETIFKIQAQAAILASNPVTAALAALAYGQIPLVLASAGIQAAAIAAKPIAKYAEGTDDHPYDGLAIVGDGGRHEVAQLPDGSLHVTPDTPTLMHLPKHSKVFPSFEDFMASVRGGLFPHPPDVGGMEFANKAFAKELIEGISNEVNKGTSRLVKAVNSRPSERTTITEEGFRHQIYQGNSWATYVNRYIKDV